MAARHRPRGVYQGGCLRRRCLEGRGDVQDRKLGSLMRTSSATKMIRERMEIMTMKPILIRHMEGGLQVVVFPGKISGRRELVLSWVENPRKRSCAARSDLARDAHDDCSSSGV
jgi:hypothetical protein